MRVVLPALLCLLLVACVPRGTITLSDQAAAGASTVQVFAGTTRAVSDGNYPTTARGDLSYFRFDVAIPPEHQSGQITWPSGTPDLQTDFVTTDAVQYRSGETFLAGMRRALAAQPNSNRDVVIFVHGYNTTFAEGVYRMAQLAHDFEEPAITAHFAWPSGERVTGYVQDRDSVLYSRDHFEEFLRLVDRSGAGQTTIVAHSLGNLLVTETLRQIHLKDPAALPQLVDSVVMMSPDIDVDLFLSQVRDIEPLPDPFVIITSQKDAALRLAERLGGDNPRLGRTGDATALADLNVTLLDVTAFSDGSGSVGGHFVAGDSAALISILNNVGQVDEAFQRGRAVNPYLLSDTVLTIRGATQVVMTPTSAQ